MPHRRRIATLSLFILLVSVTSCASQPERAATEQPTVLLPPVTAQVPEAVVVGAGDIADCNYRDASRTADLISQIPGTVITLGDNAYPTGTPDEFKHCYDPAWGRFKSRTRPAPGNHDYYTTGAQGYFGYFGAAAGDPKIGYYSYDLGAWHVVVINSNCAYIGGCSAGSLQEQWLRADLKAHRAACALAYWHHPLFTSGPHGKDYEMQPIWQALFDNRATVVLNGHDHMYERFAPQTPSGELNLANGIREFVVGTGGLGHSAFGPARLANSEVSRDRVLGVIKLSLHAASYDWEFIPVAGGQNFRDAGNGKCH